MGVPSSRGPSADSTTSTRSTPPSPDDPVHVYGTQVAERRPSDVTVAARVEDSETDSLFRISAGGESAAIRRTLASSAGLLAVGPFLAEFGGLAVLPTL